MQQRWQPRSNSSTTYKTAREAFGVRGEGDDAFVYYSMFCFGHTCCYCETDEDEGLWTLELEDSVCVVVHCEKHEAEARADHGRIEALRRGKAAEEAARLAQYGDRDTLRMNGVALVLCSVNPEFSASARRLIAGEGSEEDKKSVVWALVKATKSFSLEVFERWLMVAQL